MVDDLVYMYRYKINMHLRYVHNGKLSIQWSDRVNILIITSPPEGVARYCFHLSVCLSVCVCVSVCPANIFVFYFSATRRDIDLKLIQYRVVLN